MSMKLCEAKISKSGSAKGQHRLIIQVAAWEREIGNDTFFKNSTMEIFSLLFYRYDLNVYWFHITRAKN